MATTTALSLPKPQNEYRPPKYWVFGLELLESVALDFFVYNVAGSLMPPVKSRSEIEENLHLSCNNPNTLLLQLYEFFTKRLVKSVRKRPEAWLALNPALMIRVEQIEYTPNHLDNSSLFGSFIPSWKERRNNFQLTLSGRTPAAVFNDQIVTIRYNGYTGTESNSNALLLPSLALGAKRVSRIIEHAEDWITPLVQKTPFEMYSALHLVGSLIPNTFSQYSFGFRELLSQMLDWLSTDQAPKNISRLDPLDAARLTREWHLQHFTTDGSKKVKRSSILPTLDSVREYTPIWSKGDWAVFALESTVAFHAESNLMDHCIGKSNRYVTQKFAIGSDYIPMTLRSKDKEGKYSSAHATFDYSARTRGFTQLKGPKNQVLSLEASNALLDFFLDLKQGPVAYKKEFTVRLTNDADVFFGTPSVIASYLHVDALTKDHPLYSLLKPTFKPSADITFSPGQISFNYETGEAFVFDGFSWNPIQSGTSVQRLSDERVLIVHTNGSRSIIEGNSLVQFTPLEGD